MPAENASARVEGGFEQLVAEAFRRSGWRVRLRPKAGLFVVERGNHKYAVEVKSTSEGRRDRLIPLLSQAILEARTLAREFGAGAAPLAIVATQHVRPSVAQHVAQFAQRHAPGVAFGIVDADGLLVFEGPGLEALKREPARRRSGQAVRLQSKPDLFSDLNQWMIKVLLGRDLPEALISVPRQPIRNASQLAMAAGVSVMSATRFVRQAESEGFLEPGRGDLRLVRIRDLLERWASAGRIPPREAHARWMVKKDPRAFLASVRRYIAESGVDPLRGSRSKLASARKAPPRICIGLFAAADALGVGFVRGVSPHLYLEHLDDDVPRKLGLSLDAGGGAADVILRIPSSKESVFRAAVMRNQVPVADVLQVWLDASAHPARGREQADEIRRRIFRPMLGLAS